MGKRPVKSVKPRKGKSRAATSAARAPPVRAGSVSNASVRSAPAPVRGHQPVPIVGIGASAGGLDALERFLNHVPLDSGLAYVVVQHLEPHGHGALPDILGRVTPLPVSQVVDLQPVAPNHVYVIPPRFDLSVLRGLLQLSPRTPQQAALPIDLFFRSLAEDQQGASIAVVLSGLGSDGTLGLRAIKENAGATFVQAPASAKFDGMPRSAIDAGLADVVDSAEHLPGKILAYRAQNAGGARDDFFLEQKAAFALDKIFGLLKSQTANDFSLYKKSTIYRRIERRMGLHQIGDISVYVRYLRENLREVDLLFRELLIGVTSFFRDGAVWEALKSEVLPPLIDARPTGSMLRAWVPACSTGEEAYSLAIAFKETVERLPAGKSCSLQIFATDLDRQAIDKARAGIYPANIVADVSPERLRRFFVPDERGFRVTKDIREMVVFAPQNMIMDPPFTKIDLLSCRNLLIYLSTDLQKKLIPLFHYALNPGGALLLGSAETVGSFSQLFAPIDAKLRAYRRLETQVTHSPIELPTAFLNGAIGMAIGPGAEPARAHPVNIQHLADRVLAQKFSPAAVLTTPKGDILYVSGSTGKYLEAAPGKANWNLFVMAREGLRAELGNAFAAALREQGPVTASGLKVSTEHGSQLVDVVVQQLVEPEPLRGVMMVVFTDVSVVGKGRRGQKAAAVASPNTARVRALEKELLHAREEAQTVREEMQTSQEELKSSNEELQSTNEELQSTNEELTTSKEELQSLNEELQTVNHELQGKVDELSRSNNDMKNLLNSTDIATLFLDGELLVRRFTTQTAKIIKLIPGDAGRPVTDITTSLEYPELADDARDVLRTLVFKEKLVATKDGRWFSVRILPYRTLENVIDGVVITFTDATASKALEAQLRSQTSELKQMAEALPTLVWGGRPDGSCDYLSQQWLEYTGVPEARQLGDGWLDQVHVDDRDAVREGWRQALHTGQAVTFESRLRHRSGAYRWFKTRAVPIRGPDGGVQKWYGTYTDVDDVKRGLDEIAEHLEEAVVVLDRDLVTTYLNQPASALLGAPEDRSARRPMVELVPADAREAFRDGCSQVLKTGKRQVVALQLPTGAYESRIYRFGDGLSVLMRRSTLSGGSRA